MEWSYRVLNLVIRGLPSIPLQVMKGIIMPISFKPYYNRNAFNTLVMSGDLKAIKTKSFKPNSTGFLKCSNWSYKQINQVY